MARLLKHIAALLPLLFVASPALACSSNEIFPNDFEHEDYKHIFSTVAWQFTSMVNGMLGSLYCKVQNGAEIIVRAAILLFICIYAIQVIVGSAQLNGRDGISRIIKMSVVYFIVASDQAWSAGMGLLLQFFVGFIFESTGWVMGVFGAEHGGGGGISGVFSYMDTLIADSFGLSGPETKSELTGINRDEAIAVFSFFVSLVIAMPTLFFIVLYFCTSVFMVFLRTMIALLVAIIAIALLISLGPIFVSCMLFQMTYRFFETWIKFMTSFALQVMISFAVLALYFNSMLMFKDFFVELAAMVMPYDQSLRFGPSNYFELKAHGVCEWKIEIKDNRPSAKCLKEEPSPADVVAPTSLQKESHFMFYLFYHFITMIIVSYGFATLQKNLQQFCSQLAGPQWVPHIGGRGASSNLNSVLYGGDAKRYMAQGANSSFTARHEGPATAAPQKSYAEQFTNLVTKR